eukprot:gene10606-22141_t
MAKRTRPDILTTIAFLAPRVLKSTKEDWNKLEQLLKYINHSRFLCLALQAGENLRVEAYIDASVFPFHKQLLLSRSITTQKGANQLYIQLHTLSGVNAYCRNSTLLWSLRLGILLTDGGNTLKLQILPDRLIEDVRYCRNTNMEYTAAKQHLYNEDELQWASKLPHRSKSKQIIRAIYSETDRCTMCMNMFHEAHECLMQHCSICNKINAGHNARNCPGKVSDIKSNDIKKLSTMKMVHNRRMTTMMIQTDHQHAE